MLYIGVKIYFCIEKSKSMRALVGNSLFVALLWDGKNTFGTALGRGPWTYVLVSCTFYPKKIHTVPLSHFFCPKKTFSNTKNIFAPLYKTNTICTSSINDGILVSHHQKQKGERLMLNENQTRTITDMLIRELNESFEEDGFGHYTDHGRVEFLKYIVEIGKLIEALNLDLSLLQKKQMKGDK
tara:strand:- start:1437 stop:1985 length:549 start_codon:yes stop_codon:yes gene_type:complete